MIVGLEVANDHLVAVMVAVPSMISAAVGWVAWRTNRHARVAANSVRPNGQGSVIEIIEEILQMQRALQTHQVAQESRTADRLLELGDRISRCECRHDLGGTQ